MQREEPSPTYLDDEQLKKLASWVVNTGVETPAILYLEMTKPISVVQSSMLVALDPLVTTLLPVQSFGGFSRTLGDREQVERMIQAIEAEIEARKKVRNEPNSTEGGADGNSPSPDETKTNNEQL